MDLLARQVSIPVASTAGRSGVAWLECTMGAALYFSLFSLPKPASWGPGGTGRSSPGQAFRLHRRARGGAGYWIVHEPESPEEPMLWTRFRLSASHNRATLRTVAEHLNNNGAQWLYLAREDKGRVPGLSFARLANELPDL